jgi:hypothetical protein
VACPDLAPPAEGSTACSGGTDTSTSDTRGAYRAICLDAAPPAMAEGLSTPSVNICSSAETSTSRTRAPMPQPNRGLSRRPHRRLLWPRLGLHPLVIKIIVIIVIVGRVQGLSPSLSWIWRRLSNSSRAHILSWAHLFSASFFYFFCFVASLRAARSDVSSGSGGQEVL